MKTKVPGNKAVSGFPSGGLFGSIPGEDTVKGLEVGISWLLNDEFRIALPAGSVNGTAAEPGPGARTVVDTGNKLSLSSGRAVITAGIGWGNPAIVYPTPIITRIPGIMVVGTIKTTGGAGPMIGFSASNSSFATGDWQFVIGVDIPTELYIANLIDGGSYQIGALTDNIEYKLFCVLRASGAYFFAAGGTEFANISLVATLNVGNVATLYAGFTGYPDIGTSDFIRIPQALFLPVPLLSDGFGGTWPTSDGLGNADVGLGAGQAGLIWLDMGNASIAGGVLTLTPVVGVTLINDPGMDNAAAWIVGANWDVGVTSAGKATRVAAAVTSLTDNLGTAPVAHKWYELSSVLTRTAGSVVMGIGGAVGPAVAASSSPVHHVRATTTGKALLTPDVTFAGTADDFNAKLNPISTLITNQQLITTDVLAEAVISAYTLGTQAGFCQSDRPFAFPTNATAAAGQPEIVLKNLTHAVQVGAIEDTITILHPIAGGTTYTIASVGALVAGVQAVTLDANLVEEVVADDMIGVDWALWNGVLVYFDGEGNIKTDEIVAGVYTNRGSTATAFATDARLIPRKIGASYYWFYNEALIASTAAIDAAAMAGKYHGLFSTAVGNTITSMVIYDTGNVTNLYANLDRFSKD